MIDLLYQELQGQPGLTSWFGELLTETCNFNPDQPIGLSEFQYAYVEARDIQPNSNITNLVKKAHHPEYRQVVLSLFQTKEKVAFTFDDDYLNFPYLNGIIDIDRTPEDAYVKFSSPFVQKRLFNSFSIKLFRNLGQLHDPFEDLSDTITETSLSIPHLIKRYEAYLKQNRAEVLDHAPRKTDLHVYEAILHFHLYKYLTDFLHSKGGHLVPEFPTGNGQIDLIIHYADQIYGLEVKSFASAQLCWPDEVAYCMAHLLCRTD